MWKLEAYHHPPPPEEKAAGELGVPIQFASNGALQLYQSGPDFSSPNAQIILAWQADAQAGAWLGEAVASYGDARPFLDFDESSFDVSAPGQAPVAPATPPTGADPETILLAELAADTVETLLGDVSDRVSEFLGALVTAAANVGINLSPSRTEGYLALNDPGAKDTATDAVPDYLDINKRFLFTASDGKGYVALPDANEVRGYRVVDAEEYHAPKISDAVPTTVATPDPPSLATLLAARYRNVATFEAPEVDVASVLFQQELDDMFGGDDPLPSPPDADASWLSDAGAAALSPPPPGAQGAPGHSSAPRKEDAPAYYSHAGAFDERGPFGGRIRDDELWRLSSDSPSPADRALARSLLGMLHADEDVPNFKRNRVPGQGLKLAYEDPADQEWINAHDWLSTTPGTDSVYGKGTKKERSHMATWRDLHPEARVSVNVTRENMFAVAAAESIVLGIAGFLAEGPALAPREAPFGLTGRVASPRVNFRPNPNTTAANFVCGASLPASLPASRRSSASFCLPGDEPRTPRRCAPFSTTAASLPQ